MLVAIFGHEQAESVVILNKARGLISSLCLGGVPTPADFHSSDKTKQTATARMLRLHKRANRESYYYR